MHHAVTSSYDVPLLPPLDAPSRSLALLALAFTCMLMLRRRRDGGRKQAKAHGAHAPPAHVAVALQVEATHSEEVMRRARHGRTPPFMQLHTCTWEVGAPTGVAVLLHGLNGHS